MAEITIRVTNPGKTSFFVDIDKWKYRGYRDPRRPRELELQMPRSVPIQQRALIECKDGNDMLFRGYAHSYRTTKLQKTWKCRGLEALLLGRRTPPFNYCFTDITLGDLFDDDLDMFDGVPGLLRIANSYMPPSPAYTVVDAVKGIIKLSGWGTGSRAGECDITMISELQEDVLTEYDALVDLDSNDMSFYRDASDLWIRYDGGGYANMYWYLHGGVMLDNAFDTLIRAGDIEGASDPLQGGLMVRDNQILDLLANLAESHGYYMRYRDNPAWGGYLYIDATSDPGDGATDGLYELTEEDCIELEKSIPGEPAVQALVGRGEGRQLYSKMVSTDPGLWLMGEYEVQNGFRDSNGCLIPFTDAEYLARSSDYKYRIATLRNLLMRPGDFLKINVDYEPVEILAAEMIERSSEGKTVLELNGRDPDFADALKALRNFDNGYYDYYLWEFSGSISASCTFKPSDLTHNCSGTPGAMTFAVPANVKDAALKSRITLDLSMNLSNYTMVSLGRWFPRFSIGTTKVPYGRIANHMMGETISKVDITDQITAGANNTVNVYADLLGEVAGTHTSCTGHPDISCSATMKFWRRLYVPS